MNPQATVYIEAVRINRGETLSIYAYPDKPFENAIQIELRITPNGKVELFCNTEIPLQSFAEWKSLEKR